MNTQKDFPETLHDAILYFSTGDNALNFMVQMRWPHGVVCPRCGCDKNSFMRARHVWECKDCRKQFSVKVGSIFEDSPIKLDKWMCAMWLLSSAKNGISSYELHRSLGVTQKTAWFMLQRLRLALHNGSIEKMSGHVEADETYIGGKARSMNAKQKAKRREKVGSKTGGIAMTPVQGLLERSTREKASRVKLRVLRGTKKADVQGQVREHVIKGAEVHTDALASYNGLSDEYTHNVVDHAECYVKGNVHTNGLENFWSLLKRTIKGTYVNVEPFHLFRYLDEQAFRFNERRDDDQGRFLKAVSGVFGKGLRYTDLIGGAQGLPQAG